MSSASTMGMEKLANDGASVQVLNLSFPRCGTMSVQYALNQLGYRCWHSTTCFGDREQCQRWIAAQDAKFLNKGDLFTRADWDAVFAGYTAVSADPPAIGFATDLTAAYPEAKVILVERDEDAWFESFDATTMDHFFRWDLHAVSNLDPHLIGPVRDMQLHWVRSWWKVDSKAEMRSKARDMYRQHNRRIRETVPPHRLLIYRLDDGWGPLCAFLGKDVPQDMPFPVKNDRTQVKARNSFIRMRGLQMVIWKMLPIVGPVCMSIAAWWWFRKAG